jgi:hypothetical protein
MGVMLMLRVNRWNFEGVNLGVRTCEVQHMKATLFELPAMQLIIERILR